MRVLEVRLHVRRRAEDHRQMLHESLQRASKHSVLTLKVLVGLGARLQLALELLCLRDLLLLQILHSPLAPLPQGIHGVGGFPFDMIAYHIHNLADNLALDILPRSSLAGSLFALVLRGAR
jgi:hypothetical protein